jgi:hypothetical protein
MNEKHQENATPRAPLILTVPAYSFVVALHLDCLGRSNRAAFSDEPFVKELKAVETETTGSNRSLVPSMQP